MKRLILLRHAKSSWDEPNLSDHDRPLARRGLRDARKMGRRLARHGAAPDLLLTSSALRAAKTTELVADALPPERLTTRVEPGIYLATPGELLAVIAGVDDSCEELIVVGHNPGMTQLVNMLLPALELANLPTAGAIAIDCDCESWAEIDGASFRLRYCEFPKASKAPGPGSGQSTSQKQ